MIRITYRKHKAMVDKEVDSWYAVVTRAGRPMWSCEHDHTSVKRALGCGRRWLRLGAGNVPAARPASSTSHPKALGTRQRIRSLSGVTSGKPEIRRSTMERLIACAVSEGDMSENAAFGSFVHDCIYEYLLACVQAHAETRWSQLRQIVTNQFYRVPRGLPPERLDEAQDLLDRFAHTHQADLAHLLWLPVYEPGVPGDTWVTDNKLRPALEYTMKLDVGWATITGTVDRLNRMDGDDPDDPPRIVQAIDYKSQWAASPHLFQGRSYAALAFAQPWAHALKEFWWMPDPFKLRRDPLDSMIVYQRGDLDEWWSETLTGVRQRWELRASGRAVPTGGAACQYCALRYSCPQALPVARGMPENNDQAEELAGEWLRLEQSTKLRKESLAAWFSGHAPMQVNGLTVGFLEPLDERFVTMDMAGIISHLNASGLDGASVLFTAVDKEKIPRDIRPQLVEAGVAKMVRGPATFKHRKAGAKAGDKEDDA